ncbi:alpha/beta fold hydrolase [Thermocrispum municipale]|uniref:alpha/beta fold hydrolase n=1 Tax=Thermocrispum municipale TaxID=37926 RepID=UPI0003FD1738|nr:alpha/beta hydrolase [Thermocrispum municipale]
MKQAPDPSSVRTPGPWTHRTVSANGISLHVAQADGPADGPLVVLLHGFAGCWWVWHRQMPELAAAGYRVVAADLRGYGDSDKPPRGYDAWTLSGDIAGLVRALGASKAHLIGQGWGGALAWTAAVLHPRVVSSVGVLGGWHPLALRPGLRRCLYNSEQRRATGHFYRFQVPMKPERDLVAHDAAAVEHYLRKWAGPAWVDTPEFGETARYLRSAMQIPGAAHCALEFYRWAFRSLFRGDGRRFAAAMRDPSPAPVLQLHGRVDGCVLPRTAKASAAWAGPGSWLQELPGVGHYPQLEAPEKTTELLLKWLAR